MANFTYQNSGINLEDEFIQWNEVGLPIPNQSNAYLFMWGNNSYGELGQNNITPVSSPVQISSSIYWKTGSICDTSAYIKPNGSLWTWGANQSGALGQSLPATTLLKSSPVQVGALTNWSMVDIGWSDFKSVIAIKTDGSMWAWGDNTNGVIGQNVLTPSFYSSPIQIGSLTNWASVSVGGEFALAVKTDGSLWSWGSAIGGTLGSNNVTSRSSPLQVGALTNWARVFASYTNSAAIKTDGSLWTWGANSTGALGSGTTTARSSPVQVGLLTTWRSISLGDFAIAIQTNNTLWSWGSSSKGQSGRSVVTRASSPIQVGALTNWKIHVSNGDDNVGLVNYFSPVIAVKTDGTLWSWGWNGGGNLGLGDQNDRSSPVQVGSLTTWKGLPIKISSGLNGSPYGASGAFAYIY